MSIRNLDPLFAPTSVAVIGASHRPGSLGATVWANLRRGAFTGQLLGVNPKHRDLDGQRIHAHVRDLPTAPDLAVICTPPPTVAGLIGELGALGTRAAVVLTTGIDAAQKAAIQAAARPHLLRILGPCSRGLLLPPIGLNASLAQSDALTGELAFVSQSGALVSAMLDWGRSRAIGFSHVVSLGESVDVDVGDTLDYLASDARTRAILLYIEGIESPRKFMSAARAAARNKPVILVKAGRSHGGKRAAAAHTGARFSSDRVYEAAFARAGMLRVDTLLQLFMAAETLARFRANRSEELVILSNSGGAGVVAADAAAHAGVELAELGVETLSKLDALLPAGWSRGNPVDVDGDAPVERYQQAIQTLSEDAAGAAVLFIHAPTANVDSGDLARALAPLASQHEPRLIASWLGVASVAEAHRVFREAGIASYPSPEQAVRAFAMLVTYRRNQAQLMEAPPSPPPSPGADTAAVRELVQLALADGREWLTERETRVVLEAYGIPVVTTRSVSVQPRTVARAADAIGYPVVLKIRSPDIRHRTDVGGVARNLVNAAEVRAAARAMLARVSMARPGARIEGFSVQPMVQRSHAHELFVGAAIDPVFGPVIVFGHGGTAVELVADRAVALPPLNLALARALVRRTRIARLFAGFRDTPPADQDALLAVLVAVSQLLADVPEVAALDINPLILSHEGAVALDARISVSAETPAGARNFAIRPYPGQLIETLAWRGRSLTLRPIRPEDEAQHLAFLEKLSPEDVRMRVFYSRRSIERSELARLTQIDYEREMAIIAVAPGADGVEETLGVARAVADPDNIDAEFGIIIRSDIKGGGLGRLLMHKLIRTQREHGTRRLVATVLAENVGMLALARELGFVQSQEELAGGVHEIHLDLQARADNEHAPPAA